MDRAIQKYGESNFTFNVIDTADDQETLNMLERLHIARYESMVDQWGYNIKEGGSNGKHSEESRQKMSETKRQRLGLNHDKIVNYYVNDGLSTIQIGKTFNCSNQAICNVLTNNRVKLRNRREAGEGRGLFGFTAQLNKNKNPEKKCWRSGIRWKGKIKSLGIFEDPYTASLVHYLISEELEALE